MYFKKSKSSIKYYILAIICVLCVYSAQISNLFIPLFDNVYYGNLVNMFVSLMNAFIWMIEFLIIFFVCKKRNIKLFTSKDLKNKELPLWRLILLFIVAIIPMFIISAFLHFQVKIVYQLGIKVTAIVIACNACEILSWAMRMVFIAMFINFIHLAFETNFKFNKDIFNKFFPWGALFCFLIFGLIDCFFFPVDLNWFYLLASFWYGVIYLVGNRKFATTYVLSYLIWLL